MAAILICYEFRYRKINAAAAYLSRQNRSHKTSNRRRINLAPAVLVVVEYFFEPMRLSRGSLTLLWTCARLLIG